MCENKRPASKLSKVIVLQATNACIELRVVTSGNETTIAANSIHCCRKPHIAHNFVALYFIQPELLSIEVLIAQI